MTNINNKNDTQIFLEYLNHKNFWVTVFRPDINGEVQKGGVLEDIFLKSKKSTLETLEKYDNLGLPCVAINEHSFNDKSLKSIDRIHSLIIDIDVKKHLKEGYVSLDQHHNQAIEKAYHIKEYLENKGFSVSLIVDSGNGAHIYIYIDERFNQDFIDKKEEISTKYKDKLHISNIKKEYSKLIGDLWKSQDIYYNILEFEKEIKNKFQTDILDIDNITKDINRRMKVPGFINKKDIQQKEDRISKIIYFNENYKNSSNQNVVTLKEYKPSESVKAEIVSEKSVNSYIQKNDTIEVLKRFNKIVNSNKEHNKEVKDTFEAKNLSEMFGGDRSNAEQSLVNLLVFRGFHSFDAVDLIMSRSEIGKWQESPAQYKENTFKKAYNLWQKKQEEKESRKNEVIDYFSRYQIFLLMDDPKTKYVVYDNTNNNYFEKHGDENLAKMLHIIAVNNEINLTNLTLFYFESKKNMENLLLDFLRDNKVIKTINNIGFKPTNELIYEEEGKQFFNKYVPNEYLILEKSNQKIKLEKDCPSINRVLTNITGNDEEGKKYLINLLSFMIKNPHIKTGKLIVFFGEEAAGKGIFYSQILKSLFGKYSKTITGRDLESNYNGFLSEVIALYINEVSNRKEYENTLKNWITEEEILINNKYGSSGSEKTFFTIFADVNGNNPIKAGERRGVYFKSKTLGNDKNLAPEIGAELVDKIPKEINLFAQYLVNYDCSYDYLNQGYETQAKKDILNASKSIEDNFIDEMFSYSDFESFVNSINDYPIMSSKYINLGDWIKNNFIEVNLFHKLYNIFRKRNEYREVDINKFTWFYDKLNIDRKNPDHFTRRYNDYKKNVYWINADIIAKKYSEYNEEVS